MDKLYLLSSLPSPSSFLHKQCEYTTDYSCIILQDTKHIALSLLLSLPHWLSLSLTHTHTCAQQEILHVPTLLSRTTHIIYNTQKFLRKKFTNFLIERLLPFQWYGGTILAIPENSTLQWDCHWNRFQTLQDSHTFMGITAE